MEQTWRWLAPKMSSACPTSGRPSNRHRHRLASHPLRHRLVGRGDREAQRHDNRRPVAGPALERGRKPARFRSRSSLARASSRCSTITASRLQSGRLRRHHRLLQLHAGARLDPHRTGAPAPGGARALRFNAHEYAARLLHAGAAAAEDEHDPAVIARAKEWFDKASEDDKRQLLSNIMAGLPGAFDRYDAPGLRRMLDRYKGMTRRCAKTSPASCAR